MFSRTNCGASVRTGAGWPRYPPTAPEAPSADPVERATRPQSALRRSPDPPGARAHPPQRTVRTVRPTRMTGPPPVPQQVDVQFELLVRRCDLEHRVVQLIEGRPRTEQLEPPPDARDVGVDRDV